MNWRAVRVIAGQVFRELQRTRWFLVIAATFGVLAMAFSALGLASLGSFGVTGFGRTSASLMNLALLIVPLMGLLVGALSLAMEQEQGTLLTLMAQPVTAGEVFAGTFAGLAGALSLALVLGFGLSGAVIAYYSDFAYLNQYLALVSLTLVLGLIHVGCGLCLSVVTRRVSTALGLALVVWLAIVLLSDLGLMGTAMILQLKPAQLFWLSVGSPLQAFKIAVVQVLQGNLELLGACGLYASSKLGPALLPALLGILAAWVIGPLALAQALFRRRGAL